MRGKEKCRILREIRQRIADENDIPYATKDCGFRGECRGTCPKCESELRYLERQLAARAALGKRVAVAALCASMGFAASGCAPSDLLPLRPRGGDIVGDISFIEPTEEPGEDPTVLMGEIAYPEDGGEPTAPDTEIETGEIAPPAEDPEPAGPEPFELTGDVAWFPEDADNG